MFKFNSLINQRVKRSISSEDFKELKNLMSMYESRYYARFVCSVKKPQRLLGQNGLKFLLSSLQRSRFLFTGLIDCLNRPNLTLSFLAVRSHFETTGSVAYYYSHLQQFYGGKIDFNKMDNILRRLSIGCKNFPVEEKKDPSWVDAINVLTLIDEADKLFNEMAKEKMNVFRGSYDFLSEFCHPNLFGLTIHAEIINSRNPTWVVFHKSPLLKKKEYSTLISHLMISSHFFFPIYDKAFSIIKDIEEVPSLYKS